MKISDNEIKTELLNVYFKIDTKGKKIINWDYGDRPNCYFLLGVLDVIKDELIQQILEESEELEDLEK